jgi:uncharacterized membrane protein YqaE (UPF0057 family)
MKTFCPFPAAPSFLVLLFLSISCAPKYNAYFPKKTYDQTHYAVDQQKSEKEGVSVSSDAIELPQQTHINEADVKLVETVETGEIEASNMEKESGVLKLVKKADRNAVMTEREELILDALQIRLKEISKADKKAFKKDLKNFIHNQEKAAAMEDYSFQKAESIKSPKALNETSTNTLLLVILAILIPPLAVGLHEEALNGTFWLNLILTLIFYVPGLIHALIVILRDE